MEPLETVETDKMVIGCDGGVEPYGHPMVYLTIGADKTVDCPYCGRRYVFSGTVSDDH